MVAGWQPITQLASQSHSQQSIALFGDSEGAELDVIKR